jgi:hypothetical protein
MGVVGSRGQPVAASGRGFAVGVLVCLACASTLRLEDGRWRHGALGYSIDALAPGWVPLELDGVDLAFRGPSGATRSLSTRCHTPLAEPPVLARHLVIGLPDRSRLEARAVLVDGRPGWLQRYEVTVDASTRQLTSVTTVVRECVIDFVLVEPRAAPGSAQEFERWWGSFRWNVKPQVPS